MKSIFKPDVRLVYTTYETSNELQLKCQLIHKTPPAQTGAMFMSPKEKIGLHGLRNFCEYIGSVTAKVIDENTRDLLETTLREVLPALCVEGFWPKVRPELTLAPVVYHASSVMGLTEIVPKVGTHGKAWVYGTFDPVMSAVFLSGIGGDFTCAVLRCEHTGAVIVNERLEGAFELRYGNQKGCLYTLDNANFINGQTDWPEELVAEGPQGVLASAEIDDIANYLRGLEGQGHLIIIKYPQKHPSLPADDVKRYHPQLTERVEAMIEAREINEAKKYEPTSSKDKTNNDGVTRSEKDLDRIRRLLFGENKE